MSFTAGEYANGTVTLAGTLTVPKKNWACSYYAIPKPVHLYLHNELKTLVYKMFLHIAIHNSLSNPGAWE